MDRESLTNKNRYDETKGEWHQKPKTMAQDEVIIRAVIPSVFFKPRWLQAGKKKQRSKPRGERIMEGREEVTDRALSSAPLFLFS